jgi:alkanesulfonate monooxygenase SsuD/methylene tetrahydromethanopterin reductase-like flavin-dependent oxidoreductase (luciferase family)
VKYGFIATQGTIAENLELARMVEDHGWDGFFTWDGISVGSMPTWDPWVLMGAVATQTERVTLGAIVHPLSRRRPWKVAREALTVDHLSDGRLVIPVALGALDDGGFSRVQPEVTDRKARAERLDETLEILKLAWKGEPFSYSGTHYQVEDLVFQPTPVNGDIPIWVVGAWPSRKSVGRAARYEGIMPSLVGEGAEPPSITPDHLREIAAWISERRESDALFEYVIEGVTPIGDPDAASEQVRSWADAGATWWIESMWGDYTLDDLRRRIAQGPPRVEAAV